MATVEQRKDNACGESIARAVVQPSSGTEHNLNGDCEHDNHSIGMEVAVATGARM